MKIEFIDEIWTFVTVCISSENIHIKKRSEKFAFFVNVWESHVCDLSTVLTMKKKCHSENASQEQEGKEKAFSFYQIISFESFSYLRCTNVMNHKMEWTADVFLKL